MFNSFCIGRCPCSPLYCSKVTWAMACCHSPSHLVAVQLRSAVKLWCQMKPCLENSFAIEQLNQNQDSQSEDLFLSNINVWYYVWTPYIYHTESYMFICNMYLHFQNTLHSLVARLLQHFSSENHLVNWIGCQDSIEDNSGGQSSIGGRGGKVQGMCCICGASRKDKYMWGLVDSTQAKTTTHAPMSIEICMTYICYGLGRVTTHTCPECAVLCCRSIGSQ